MEDLAADAQGMLPVEREYGDVLAALLSGEVVTVREVERGAGVDRVSCMEVAKLLLEEGLLVFAR